MLGMFVILAVFVLFVAAQAAFGLYFNGRYDAARRKRGQ